MAVGFTGKLKINPICPKARLEERTGMVPILIGEVATKASEIARWANRAVALGLGGLIL